LISVAVWSGHFFALLRCDVAAHVSVAVMNVIKISVCMGFVLWGGLSRPGFVSYLFSQQLT
jgi:hypothetical protein